MLSRLYFTMHTFIQSDSIKYIFVLLFPRELYHFLFLSLTSGSNHDKCKISANIENVWRNKDKFDFFSKLKELKNKYTYK